MKTRIALLIVAATCILTAYRINADERFELSIPGRSDVASSAILSNTGVLWVNHQDSVFRYERASKFDSNDGHYVGFYCAAADRAIRWPISGSGPLQGIVGEMWQLTKMQVSRINRLPEGRNPFAESAVAAAPVRRQHVTEPTSNTYRLRRYTVTRQPIAVQAVPVYASMTQSYYGMPVYSTGMPQQVRMTRVGGSSSLQAATHRRGHGSSLQIGNVRISLGR